MIDYEKISASEVQRLVKQGDKEAMFEMVWRPELMPSGFGNNPVENCAWQDYWFEKAADAGHIDAKSRYARSLINRIMNAEDRQKAMRLFESLVADFDAGRLGKEEEIDGILSKMWLGIMLCEGYHTQRDAIRGAELIQAADALTNGFNEFGFGPLSKIGDVYATGLAQPGEEPSLADLEKAAKYIEKAIRRFKPDKDDPNNRGYLQLRENMLIEVKTEIDNFDGSVTVFAGANERRKKMMEISDAARQRMEADKAALARLRERMKGW